MVLRPGSATIRARRRSRLRAKLPARARMQSAPPSACSTICPLIPVRRCSPNRSSSRSCWAVPTRPRPCAPISTNARHGLRTSDPTSYVDASKDVNGRNKSGHDNSISNAHKTNNTMTDPSPVFLGISSGQRRRDHAEVADRAGRIASGFRKLGVTQGDSVCMLMRNDIAFIEAAYAAMRLGAYGVPVNWHFKPEEINYVLKDSGTSVVIAHDDMLHQLRDAIPSGVTVLSVPTPPEILGNYKINPDHLATPDFAIDFESWLARHERYDGPLVPQPQNMIYTAGTTGHPKGVRRFAPTPEQTANAEAMRGMIYGLTPGARTILPGPLYHSAPNSFGLRSGRLGGVLVLMPRFGAEEFLRLIEEQKIDTIFMVPTMFIRLMTLAEAIRRKYDMSSLGHIIHAAAPCPADVKRAMIEWWGPVIYEFYGSTESGAVTFANSEDALKKPGTVGKISPGAELRFIGDDGKVLPQGEIGQIYSRIAGNSDFTYHT